RRSAATAVRFSTSARCAAQPPRLRKSLRMEGFGFSTEIVVRFAETDAQGIAHHASFVVWLEVARVAYLSEHAGGYLAIQAQGIEALTTAVDVRYLRAAYFDDRLRVWTRCVDVRGARFRYEYAVERGGELVAEGS